MIGQHYKIPATPEMVKMAKPGQYIFRDRDDDQVRGFVDFLTDDRMMAIMLLEPDNLPENATLIAEEADWETRLQEIIDHDPSMAQLWTRD